MAPIVGGEAPPSFRRQHPLLLWFDILDVDTEYNALLLRYWLSLGAYYLLLFACAWFVLQWFRRGRPWARAQSFLAGIGWAGGKSDVDGEGARKSKKLIATQSVPPLLLYRESARNRRLLSKTTVLRQPYVPSPWLGHRLGGHMQSFMFATWCPPGERRAVSRLVSREDRVASSFDGGVFRMDWFDLREKSLPADAPVVFVLPGVVGQGTNVYIRHLAARLSIKYGWRVVAKSWRGIGSRLTTRRPETWDDVALSDAKDAIRHVRSHVGAKVPVMGVGFSFGGCLLTAIAGSVPQEEHGLCGLVSISGLFDMSSMMRHIAEQYAYPYGFANTQVTVRNYRKFKVLETLTAEEVAVGAEGGDNSSSSSSSAGGTVILDAAATASCAAYEFDECAPACNNNTAFGETTDSRSSIDTSSSSSSSVRMADIANVRNDQSGVTTSVTLGSYPNNNSSSDSTGGASGVVRARRGRKTARRRNESTTTTSRHYARDAALAPSSASSISPGRSTRASSGADHVSQKFQGAASLSPSRGSGFSVATPRQMAVMTDHCAFHEALTLPFTGDASVDAYFSRIEGIMGRDVATVKVPALCLLAKDDPLCPPIAWKGALERAAQSEGIVVAITDHGGHCGWFDGLGAGSWLDRATGDFLASALQLSQETAARASTDGGGGVSGSTDGSRGTDGSGVASTEAAAAAAAAVATAARSVGPCS